MIDIDNITDFKINKFLDFYINNSLLYIMKLSLRDKLITILHQFLHIHLMLNTQLPDIASLNITVEGNLITKVVAFGHKLMFITNDKMKYSDDFIGDTELIKIIDFYVTFEE